MSALKSNIPVAVKGFLMGAANVVPGVSGGTIALLTGIYEEIVEALNSFTDRNAWRVLFKGRIREFWKSIHGGFLLALGAGVILSILTLAKLMEYVLHYWPVPTWAFFFGLIIASAFLMLRDAGRWRFSDTLWAIAGLALGLVVCTLSPTQTTDDLWFIFICGAIAICTMILPGISGSFILVILGKYDCIMGAVSNMNIPVLAVFAAGCVIGILAFAKLLHWLLGRWERQTMLSLVGFVIGSLVKVWPWNDMEAVRTAQALRQGAEAAAPVDLQILPAILLFAAGIGLTAVIELLGKSRRKDSTKPQISAQ